MNIEDEEKVVEEKIKDAWTANKWRVIALVLFVLLLIVGTKAFAGTATVTWTNPTTYTDGTAIATGDISQTRIEYGSCNGAAFGTKAGDDDTATRMSVVEELLGELGARMARPYEHWNEEEHLMEYAERDRGDYPDDY
jgi:hypothetical protein